MITQGVQLIDPTGSVLATARVSDEGSHFGGTIDLRDTPPAWRAIFDEFEEIVNGQMFAFLDSIQDRIDSHQVRAIFEDGSVRPIRDLQVFPSRGNVSFRSVRAD